jgi:tripartite-type tricarboxylate transporter receptor subunit TctC
MFLPRLAALCLTAAVALLGTDPRGALAEAWPERPIILINPAVAGGSNERIKAIVFDRVAAALGKPIVMESRAGATGAIAAGITARAAPDGYTFMLGTTSVLMVAPAVQKNLPYDSLRDFTPITTLIDASMFLVVNRALSVRSPGELVEAMRREPNRFNYGSWGQGSLNFLTFEHFKILTGTDAVHVPYKGSAPLVQALLAGDVQAAFMDLPTLRPHVEAGTLRILGVAASSRYPTLPDLPTLTEQGVAMVAGGPLMLIGPAGISAPVANRLNAEVVRVLAEPDVRRQLLEIGYVAVGDTREEAANRVATELARWKRVVDAIGYQPQ